MFTVFYHPEKAVYINYFLSLICAGKMVNQDNCGNGTIRSNKKHTINNAHKSLKITAIGDGMVGKTCLLITFTKKRFPDEYVPTV